ncbi:carbohydrate ABC transporter permease [Micromonospora sp. KC606]|uniref:carbohydrate ABC transporter permease n=1 Tax=Micromonospora sp. KC606 TaxID=2530379 RepID=UPI00104B77AE|nr:carbohydrate ABC transporter permease [Micromonospora sp. KC606]TDC83142.1 carbohydrate ABC transporter permease [Micromonospora sp. KC606]
MKKTLPAKVAMYGALVFMSALWLYPVAIALYKSTSVGGWHNYAVVLNHPTFNYWHAVGNSFLMAGTTALVVMLISSLGGYAFSKMAFRGKNVIYNALLACLAVPVAALVTPLFFSIRTIGLRDTYAGVIIPLIAFNVLMMLMIMRNHCDAIPDEIIDAARVDGASTFRIYRSVLMPLSGPALANVGVLSFVYSWNEYLLPTLLLKSPEKFPVTQAISLLQFDRMSQEQISQLYAGLILMTIPSVIVYLFSQRFLQAGIASGAVKG